MDVATKGGRDLRVFGEQRKQPLGIGPRSQTGISTQLSHYFRYQRFDRQGNVKKEQGRALSLIHI